MWLDKAAVMGRQDFTHLECRDVFMWNVLSTQRDAYQPSAALAYPCLCSSYLPPS